MEGKARKPNGRHGAEESALQVSSTDREPRQLRAKTSYGLWPSACKGRTVWRLLQLSKPNCQLLRGLSLQKTSRNEEEEERCSATVRTCNAQNRFFN